MEYMTYGQNAMDMIIMNVYEKHDEKLARWSFGLFGEVL